MRMDRVHCCKGAAYSLVTNADIPAMKNSQNEFSNRLDVEFGEKVKNRFKLGSIRQSQRNL